MGVRIPPNGGGVSFWWLCGGRCNWRVGAVNGVDAKVAGAEKFGLLANAHHYRLAERE